MTCPPATHAHGTLADAAFVRELFATHDFDGVLHFAALSVVAESMRDPQRYYSHNVAATLNLPRIMREFEMRKAAGEDIPVTINGTDYPTEDGTCIRDYIHVNDLAEAHLVALDHLDHAVGMHTFNTWATAPTTASSRSWTRCGT